MKITEFKDLLVKTSRSWITFLLAMVLIVSSSYHIFAVFFSESPNETDYLKGVYPAIIGIIMAEFILFDPKRNVLRSVGFYAISIALARIIGSIITLSEPSLFALIIGGTFLINGVNLLYTGTEYLKGTSRGRAGMMASAAILAIVQVFTILLYYQTDALDSSYDDAYDLLPSVITLIQYVVLLLILDTGELRYGSVKEQANTKIESIRKTDALTAECVLKRNDAEMLKGMFADRSSWTAVDDGGPVESEIRIRLIEARVSSCMILQKWRGHDTVYATVTSNVNGSVILANRFCITGVYADQDLAHVCLLNDGGIAARFAVEKEKPEEGSDE